jgi:uncharacterized membrane protein YcaP (DUF421 family)
MATVLIRTFIIYILLIGTLRLSSKRQIGELQISELVVTFMVSELATIPIQDISIPISYSVFPIIILLALEVIVSFSITKSSFLKKLFAGNPSILIKKGKLNQKELSKLRIGINEFLGELRLKDVSDIAMVDYAILEQNGKLSVFLKEEKEPVVINGLKAPSEKGIAHAVIIDRKLDFTNLKSSGKTKKWVESYLFKHRLSIENVFLMTIDDSSNVNIIIKEEK